MIKKHSVQDLNVKIISVGNITCGGTGKTPLVAWLANYLFSKDLKVAIVLRGYGRRSPKNKPLILNDLYEKNVHLYGDEALLLKEFCPQVPVCVCADRKKGIMALKAQSNSEWIIFDDGFSQIQFNMLMNIICLDHTKPFGNGYVLPRGHLREPLNELKRADYYIFTKGEPRKRVRSQLEKIIQHKKNIFSFKYQITNAYDLKDKLKIIPLDNLKDEHNLLLCAIGHPGSFEALCEEKNITGQLMDFKDHHLFTKKDYDYINQMTTQKNLKRIVTTEKDALRLQDSELNVPCIVIECEISPTVDFTLSLDKIIKNSTRTSV